LDGDFFAVDVLAVFAICPVDKHKPEVPDVIGNYFLESGLAVLGLRFISDEVDR